MRKLLVFVGFAIAPWCAMSVDLPARPNIVVLVADDWGFSDLGAFGGEISTPNLDLLAKRGVRFSNFHVAASCAPTRSMLMTGVDSHRNGVGNLRESMPTSHVGKPGYLGSLDTKVVTAAQRLQASGYRTYVAGKWNVGSEPHNMPNQRGFDKSIIQGDTGSDNWIPSKRYLPHLSQVYWFEDGQAATMPAQFYSSQYFVDRTIDYIKSDSRKNQPFFAYVGFQANHVPVQAPAAMTEKYRGRYQVGWTALRQERLNRAIALGLVPKNTKIVSMDTTPNWSSLSVDERKKMEREMEVYAGMAEAMDQQVGRLMDYLRQSGQFDNTVFLFLSDNGPEASDYSQAKIWLATQYTRDPSKYADPDFYGIPGPGWASASASPLSTYKFYAGEGGLRTPMFMSGPGIGRTNQIEPALTHVTDIAPTLLTLAQIAPPGTLFKGQTVEPMAGVNLMPLLSGSATQVRAPDVPLGYELSGNMALFKGALKLVKNTPPVGDGQWHLYDIRNDPGETQDLQIQLPAEFAQMQADYDKYAKDNGVLPLPDGYNVQQQVVINSLLRYWLPEYGPKIAAFALGLWAALWWRRRKRRLAVR